jgi:nucleoid DNA-binding protein
MRGGGTPNRELKVLFDSLSEAQNALNDMTALKAAEILSADLYAMDERVTALEKLAGRLLARQDPNRHSPRGRYWAPPTRTPGSGKNGTVTRDRLALELQKRGFSFREARKIVGTVFTAIGEALQTGETVETVVGEFHIRRRPEPKELRRLGRTVIINQQPNRVAFTVEPGLRSRLRVTSNKEVSLPQPNVPNPLRCDKCGSLEFAQVEFHQYHRDWYSSTPGGDLRPATDTPIFTLVCLCGNPILPGRLRNCGGAQQARSFRESFERAREYRESQLPAISNKLTAGFASSILQRITALESILKARKKH